jgi:hypothetical protein
MHGTTNHDPTVTLVVTVALPNTSGVLDVTEMTLAVHPRLLTWWVKWCPFSPDQKLLIDNSIADVDATRQDATDLYTSLVSGRVFSDTVRSSIGEYVEDETHYDGAAVDQVDVSVPCTFEAFPRYTWDRDEHHPHRVNCAAEHTRRFIDTSEEIRAMLTVFDRLIISKQ